MLEPGTLAPEFDLPLLSGGRATRRSLQQGDRAALVVFFKTECPTCRLAFPFLQRIAARVRRAPEPAGFLGIAQNGLGDLPEFLEKHRADFPVASEGDPWQASEAYGVTNVPSLFLLDEHGVILRASAGFSKSEFEEISAEILARSGAAGEAPLFTSADASVPALQPG